MGLGIGEMLVIMLALVLLFGGALALGLIIRMLGGTAGRKPSERIRELEALHKQGLISEQEFQRKRAEIVEQL